MAATYGTRCPAHEYGTTPRVKNIIFTLRVEGATLNVKIFDIKSNFDIKGCHIGDFVEYTPDMSNLIWLSSIIFNLLTTKQIK